MQNLQAVVSQLTPPTELQVFHTTLLVLPQWWLQTAPEHDPDMLMDVLLEEDLWVASSLWRLWVNHDVAARWVIRQSGVVFEAFGCPFDYGTGNLYDAPDPWALQGNADPCGQEEMIEPTESLLLELEAIGPPPDLGDLHTVMEGMLQEVLDESECLPES